MRPDAMLEGFGELAVNELDVMRVLEQASVAALVIVQSVEAVEAEMMRSVVTENWSRSVWITAIISIR